MNPRGDQSWGGDRPWGGAQPWGERLGAETAAAGDDKSTARLIRDAIGIVRGRLSEVARSGIQPLLDEAASQIRPASRDELRQRYPGLPDDQIARRLVDRAARTATGLVLAIGGMLVAQETAAAASSVAPPAAGGILGAVGVTALAEVLALFALEAKLRADLSALAGEPVQTPRELLGGVLGEVELAGGWGAVRRLSLRRGLPEAAVRRAARQVARLVPVRFARIVVPEIIAPLLGAVWAARLANKQVRSTGERYWAELRARPRTTVIWGPFAPGNDGGRSGAWGPTSPYQPPSLLPPANPGGWSPPR